jgi:hypothetical protein
MKTTGPHLSNDDVRDLLEGGGDEERRDVIRLHLAQCDACARRVEAFQKIGDALRTLPRANADREFTERILERTGIASQRLFGLAGLMAGLMAAVVVGGVLLSLFTLLGVIPIHPGPNQFPVLNESWEGIIRVIGSATGSLQQLVGGKVLATSSVVTTALSLGVVFLLFGLDRVMGHRLLRGDGTR